MIKDDVIIFGNYRWLVLDVKEGEALIITEEIIALRWYHARFVDVVWADCDVRRFLNNKFYHQFSRDEKAAIITATNENPNNPWFSTNGGNATTDKVFLLSLEEACLYFGDSKARLQHKSNQTWSIDDENNSKRQAKYGNDFHWWRLRSPGYYGRTAASISKNGHVYVRGNGVHGRPRDGGGLRPALWLKLRHDN
ncbi:DUF6273 domain-containing protein [Chitinophaga sp. 22321]|uniref:DUF6273 domain-containing protein n=1 Tax=Chitinophaga hostae TaxID=2831022 RepID=A0ABS5IZT9_9BACT|nr:DUF6273 domain-containing protein [Chitinophaga hostae]MBS0028296.1 hypothetical protein [Chitinophaga hostae]